MFGHTPIETVADAQRRAKKVLPRPVYIAIIAGNEAGVTYRDNITAFREIGLVPRIGIAVPQEPDMRTSIMGQDISMPVVISPAGAQAIHPEGEVPVARAAARADIAIGQSNFSTSAFEDVVDACPKAFIQLYWAGNRDAMAERVERFRRAGTKGLILTLDGSKTLPRDWSSPPVPQELGLWTMIRYVPMALGNLRWTLRYLSRGRLPGLDTPNFQRDVEGPVPTFVEALTDWAQTPMPSWSDVRWLRDTWNGPFMVKGIISPNDAVRAIDAGATAIAVSNHGGNNIDTTPSPLRFLPSVVEAVGGRAEVTFDSGIRRGADIVKVLALGAKAGLIGRSWFYALGADGERGVSEMLDAYRLSIERTLIGLGKSSISELSAKDLVVPDGFFLKASDDLPMGL